MTVNSTGPTSSLPPMVLVSPLVSRERFAEMVGLPIGVIIGWCNKGILPTCTLGRYSLINVASLQKSCIEKDFSL